MQEKNMRNSSIQDEERCVPRMEGGFRLVKNPVWLPKEWTTLAKTRKSGQTAGLTDKYFVEPVSNRKFRSRKEVFKFLENAQISKLCASQTKRKRDDFGCKASGEAYNSSRVSLTTSGINVNNRPTKFRWVYNSSERSWAPDDITEANSGEVKAEIHGISGQEQLQSGVSEDDSASTRLTFETVIDLNKPKEDSPIIYPFGDSWPDPCFEFAVKTLTGAIPVLDDNLDLQNAILRFFSPQANAAEKMESNSVSFNSLGSAMAKGPSDGSKGSQNYISASDDLPKNLNKLIKHQAKNWLEVLGRKLCKKALDLMKNGHTGAVIDKREKKLKTSFRNPML